MFFSQGPLLVAENLSRTDHPSTSVVLGCFRGFVLSFGHPHKPKCTKKSTHILACLRKAVHHRLRHNSRFAWLCKETNLPWFAGWHWATWIETAVGMLGILGLGLDELAVSTSFSECWLSKCAKQKDANGSPCLYMYIWILDDCFSTRFLDPAGSPVAGLGYPFPHMFFLEHRWHTKCPPICVLARSAFDKLACLGFWNLPISHMVTSCPCPAVHCIRVDGAVWMPLLVARQLCSCMGSWDCLVRAECRRFRCEFCLEGPWAHIQPVHARFWRAVAWCGHMGLKAYPDAAELLPASRIEWPRLAVN